MTSLQQSFKYKGNLDQISFQNLTLEIQIPLFTYYMIDENFRNFKRQIDGQTLITSHQKLSSEDYLIQLPRSKIIGEKENSKYGFFFYHKIETLAHRVIDEFTFDIKVVAKDEFDNKIEELKFVALYGIQSNPINGFLNYQREAKMYFGNYGNLDSINIPNVDKLIENDGDKVFVINKSAYDKLLNEIRAVSNAINEDLGLYLLFLIEGLVDLSDDTPRLLASIEIYRKDWLISILNVNEVQNPQTVLNLVIKKFDTLFDFPISISKIETIEVKGDFTITSEEEVKKKYLEFYDLSLEYLENNGDFRIIRYDWNEHNKSLINKSTPVFLTKEQLILEESIDGMVQVQVKGFDGSVLWNKEFYADDPELQKLDIEVPLYLPDSIKTNPTNSFASSKRLRGRVVQLGNK